MACCRITSYNVCYTKLLRDFVLPDGLRLHYLYDSRQRRLDSRGRMARSVRDLQALMAERVAAAGPFDLILSNTSRVSTPLWMLSAAELFGLKK